jgi:predicted ferric reductase
LQALWPHLRGRSGDWHLPRPRLRVPRPGLQWVGPLIIAVSLGASWPAFEGARGEGGSVAFGLFIGAAAIMLMAWSFVLAVRIRLLEPLFGGMDRMYRVHRWVGSLALGAMWLHTRAEPEIEGGILGASKAVARLAQSAAGQAETMLYLLVALSLVRIVPYRFWRWTHKLLGVPFVLASWHFFTAEKPYSNGSGWGWWFGSFMVAGIVAWAQRVFGRGVVNPGVAYEVAAVRHGATTTELELRPTGARRFSHRPGQWVTLKIQLPGLREPHPFTIASPPDAANLRFLIRDVGDWTRRLRAADIGGAQVAVEGPYGRLRVLPRRGRTAVWVAGGVGITPFLSALEDRHTNVPHIFWAVPSADDAPGLEDVLRAQAESRVVLHLYPSDAGRRLTPDALAAGLEGMDWRKLQVALCGPTGLVDEMRTAFRARGTRHVQFEHFDIRTGIGPELSLAVDDVLSSTWADSASH